MSKYSSEEPQATTSQPVQASIKTAEKSYDILGLARRRKPTTARSVTSEVELYLHDQAENNLSILAFWEVGTDFFLF